MAAAEPYDYIDAASADKDETLNLDARGDVKEHVFKRQAVHEMDDGADRVVTLAAKWQVFFYIPFSALTESDSGTLLDFYMNTDKGNGKANTFKYVHGDGHTYVVRFDDDYERLLRLGGYHTVEGILLKAEGKI